MILREGRKAIITFIDYKAAFDTESQLFLDEALSAANVSIKVRRVIQSVFKVASGCVRIGNETSNPFNISRGVLLLGDIFSSIYCWSLENICHPCHSKRCYRPWH